jgi:uncharacterized protein
VAQSPPGRPVALVTGASSGIGKEFARQLSARGHELILVARRAERLEALAAELSQPAHVLALDLATEAAELRPRAEALGLQVDLVVNNAGFGTYGRLWEIPEGRDAESVRVNCEAVVTVTRAFVPDMVARGSGGVIVVASSAGYYPIPYEAVYAATKAFALSFAEALHTELRGTGVRCMAVNPGPVPTEWQEVAGFKGVGVVPGEIPAEQVVRESLEAWEAGRRTFIPGALIRWLVRLSSQGPRALQLRVTERLYRNRRS